MRMCSMSTYLTMFISNLFRSKCFKTCLSDLSRNLQTISHILERNKCGDRVTVKGWVKTLRDQKENVFADISDGSTDRHLQIFIPKERKPINLTAGSSIVASGTLSLAPKGQLELSAQNLEICGPCAVNEGYPFAPRKLYTLEYIRQHLHFRPRTRKFAALLRLRSNATLAICNYLASEGFINVHTPILTSNDCEGAGEVFKVLPDNQGIVKSMVKDGQSSDYAYFNKKAFLTVSGQLHLEAAAHGLSKVYTFGPTFRAENSKSRLHLSEFYMLEAEIAFVTTLQEIMGCIEQLIKHVTTSLVQTSIMDIERCSDGDYNLAWLDKNFHVLTYKEAAEILENNKDKFKEDFNSKNGFAKEHELYLVQYCGNALVFIIEWPPHMKPFYMKINDSGTVGALDLLGPNVGEVVGGSLRESDYLKLKEKVGNNTHLNWYLDLRRFGGVPTGGFGLGFERYLQLVLGISNIKDTIPFPRWPHNLSL